MKYLEILIRDTAAEEQARERADRRRERRIDAWIERVFVALGAMATVLALVGILGGCVARTRGADSGPEAMTTSASLESVPPAVPTVLAPATLEPEPEELATDTWPEDTMLVVAATWTGEGEDPLEYEKIVEALLAQCYLSDAVPMCYDYQDLMRTYCAKYGCPYPLALAVAEVESHFNMDAVGMAGEVGIMQLNPGPGGAYHAELEAATGLDPTTPAGNIAGGCYLLGKYLAEFEDPATAVMAYRMGRSGAKKALAAGADPLTYSSADMEAMERWECLVNAWRGE